MEESKGLYLVEGVGSLVTGVISLSGSVYRFYQDRSLGLDDSWRCAAWGLGILAVGLLINGVYTLATKRILFEGGLEGRV